MRISFHHGGMFVLFRHRKGDRDALGFLFKPRSQMIFSERYGYYRRAFTLGPLYFRTYARRIAATRPEGSTS